MNNDQAWRVPLGIDVLTAARQRIAWIFDNVPRIYVSFSGGADSTTMLHLVMEEAQRRGRRAGVLFVDWEAQYQLTIAHTQTLFERYADSIDPHWVALPLRTTNATSVYEPEWTCWEPSKRDLWVRQPPANAITDSAHYPFYTDNMTFEEFVPAFGHWYAQGQLCACFVGIRADESLNRWWALAREDKATLDGKAWTTWTGRHTYNAYPIYDWKRADIWTYHGRHPDRAYNPVYDRMHQAGLTLSQMRICEPYGDEQRRGLWLYQIIEPGTWGRVVARVAGANSGALYAGEMGNVMGNIKIVLPVGHTWQSFAMFLLASMPPSTAEHYRNKIAVWLRWYQQRGMEIADELPKDTGAEDMPSWRRVCKMLLKNDYWCKTLCFAPTKTGAYDRYRALMKRRRAQWNLI